MIFTIEPVQAQDGDCLLLQYGDPSQPYCIVIDGGPARGFRNGLRRRLEKMGNRKPLHLELVVATHPDESHLGGLLVLIQELLEHDRGQPRQILVRELWHNSFQALVGASYERIIETCRREIEPYGVPPPVMKLAKDAGLSQQLMTDAAQLKLTVNARFRRGIVASGIGSDRVDLEGGLRLRILGPFGGYVDELRLDWEEQLSGAARASFPRYLGETHSLSSIVLLAEYQRRRVLLPSDASGDVVLRALRAQKLLADKPLHVDVLKVPNHGSARGVDTSFYRTVTADHYLVFADGSQGNPEIAAIQMIIEARRNDVFHLHLTYSPEALHARYPIGELKALIYGAWKDGKRFTVHAPALGDSPAVIALLDPPPIETGRLDYRSPRSLWAAAAGTRVFLSYSRVDEPFMRKLKRDLQTVGFDVWTADVDLEPGTPEWTAAVEAALDAAQCMVVVLSPGAKKSRWVKRELYYAESRTLTIIPVVASGSPKTAVPIEVAHLQHLAATTAKRYKSAVPRLIDAIRRTVHA